MLKDTQTLIMIMILQKNQYSRIYGDTASFRKKFYNMDELISNCGINSVDFKNIFLYMCLMFLNKAKNLKLL